MTTADDVTYFEALSPEECRNLLETARVGRVAWQTDAGINVLPVNFHLRQGAIVFHTSARSALAALQEPTAASFQTDDIDLDSAIGWSVLVRGTTSPVSDGVPESWAPDATVGIAISTDWLAGRVVSGNREHGRGKS